MRNHSIDNDAVAPARDFTHLSQPKLHIANRRRKPPGVLEDAAPTPDLSYDM